MSEKFDFSKIEDQKKFEKFPKESKEIIINRSHQEANELKRKVEQREAENYKEAGKELDKDIQELIKDPESILRNFLDNPLPDSPKWESTIRARVKERLSGMPEKGYIHALRQSSTHLESEKEKIISALISVDLKNFDKILDARGYNKTAVLRLSIDLREKGVLLNKTINDKLDKFSLEEIQKYILDVSFSKRNPEDFGRVAKLALERLHSEPETAQEILRKTKSSIDVLNPFNKYSGIFDLPPEVLKYSFKKILEENPDRYNAKFEGLIRRTEQIKCNTEKGYQKDYQLENVVEDAKYVLDSIPELKNAFEIYSKQREINLQEELKKQEEERIKQEEEDRLFEEQSRIEHEKLENERVNEMLDERIESLSKCVVSKKIVVNDLLSWNEYRKTFYFASPKNWQIAESEEASFNYNNLQHLANFEDKYGDQVKKNRVRELAGNLVAEIEKQFDNITLPTPDEIVLKVVDNAPEIQDGSEAETLRRQFNYFNEQLESFSSKKHLVSENLKETTYAVCQKLSEIKDGLEFLHSESETRESKQRQKESIEEIKRKYLLDQVEKQIDYLRNLYSEESSLLLDSARGNAGGLVSHIGSVTMSAGLRLEQRLELKIELRPQEGIELEMGDDLESIKKRLAMVNWVAPHEIAHLVDWALDKKTVQISNEKEPDIEAAINRFSKDKKDTARAGLYASLRECMIDGIGYKMIKEYGTNDIFDESEEKRTKSAIKGFSTTLEILEDLIKNEAVDSENKSYCSMAILRFEAVGEKLVEDAKKNKIEKMIIKETEKGITRLDSLYKKLNKDTDLINAENKQEIIRLCREFFETGEKLTFPEISGK